jgi:acyl-coenzyme A synthetase/AMP-(fatty) acid ligase
MSLSLFDAACPLLTRLRPVFEGQPNAVAVRGPNGSTSYRQLAAAAADWRHRLDVLDLPPRSPVAIVSAGSADVVSAYLGVRAAGLVPLLIDILSPPARRVEILRAARPAVKLDLTTRELTATAEKPRTLPADAGYLTFSSGSQGVPKGIVGNAHGLLNFLDWQRKLVGPDAPCRVALLSAQSFDVVLRDMFLPLVCGGELCVPAIQVRSDPTAVMPWLADSQVEVVHAVPTLSTRWLAHADSIRLPGLRWLFLAGEPLYDRHVEHWAAVAPSTRVVNLYGPSEMTLAQFWHLIELPPPAGLQPVGRPLPGIRLVDAGSAGSFQITIESRHGSLGYLTGATVPADQFHILTRQDGSTRFRTQDRGRLDADGRLYVEGRLDNVVKRNGVMVDLGELTALALGHPQVRQAYCLQVDLDSSGDVVLVVEGTVDFSEREFSRDLRRSVGPAMPNEILLLDAFPMLPNGKIDRQRVRSDVEQRRAARRTAVLKVTGNDMHRKADRWK